VLRIEDLDGPRIKEGAAEAIVDTLSWLGMDWDEGPIVQSKDMEPYVAAMRKLAEAGAVFPCSLSRAEIEAAASAPQEGSHEIHFPQGLRPELGSKNFDELAADDLSWRFAVKTGPVEFVDRIAGPQLIDPSKEIGDFVVWTKRNQPAYQLAVVVDDHRQGITDIVRGDDLLPSAARQLLLYNALGHASKTPTYFHLPLVLGEDGKRLAKRHGDTRVETYRECGAPPEAIVGLVASWSGVEGERSLMSAAEFKTAFSLTTMPLDPIVFSQEQDAWVRSHCR